jgi:hypothetical protein
MKNSSDMNRILGSLEFDCQNVFQSAEVASNVTAIVENHQALGRDWSPASVRRTRKRRGFWLRADDCEFDSPGKLVE